MVLVGRNATGGGRTVVGKLASEARILGETGLADRRADQNARLSCVLIYGARAWGCGQSVQAW